MAGKVTIDPFNITWPLPEMYRSFNKALSNEKARFDLLPSALSNQPDIIQFVIIRGASTYKELYKVVVEFDRSRRPLHSRPIPTQNPDGPEVFGSKRVLNRPNAIGSSVDHKVDEIASN